jgi:hypothetical protein
MQTNNFVSLILSTIWIRVIGVSLFLSFLSMIFINLLTKIANLINGQNKGHLSK